MALNALRAEDPSELGPYRLQGRLGADEGVAYLGVDPDGRQVLVKALPANAGDGARAAMDRHAKSLASVRSHRVANYAGADTTGPLPWVAVWHPPGPALSEIPVPLDERALWVLAPGLAEALADLHAAGVTHGHVTPADVILTEEGPVLAGPGLGGSLAPAPPAEAGMPVDPTVWKPPEERRGDPVGPAADMWGWAAVLTYAATGRPPLRSPVQDGAVPGGAGAAPPPDELPAWLRGPVAAALAEHPAVRPAARTLVAPPPVQYRAPTSWSTRRRLAVVAAAVAAVAGVGAAAWLGLFLSGSEDEPEPDVQASVERPPGAEPIMTLVEGLESGDCVLTPDAYADNPAAFWETDVPMPESMAVVPCDRPHAAEVFFAGDLWDDAAAYPGDEALIATAEARCDSAFETFVGVPIHESRLVYTWWFPQETWPEGDRRVGCMARDAEAEMLDSSIRGSGQ